MKLRPSAVSGEVGQSDKKQKKSIKDLAISGNITTFAASDYKVMKYSELHRRFIKAGYKFDHAEGSHYFYTKDGKLTEPIPYHGSKEIFIGLANKLIKKYGV